MRTSRLQISSEIDFIILQRISIVFTVTQKDSDTHTEMSGLLEAEVIGIEIT